MAKSLNRETTLVDENRAAIEASAPAIEGLRHGQVEIQVHDSSVVRIMRTEKIRFYEECSNKPPDVR
jgi:hypothetical protein